jgi:hypothetical protein
MLRLIEDVLANQTGQNTPGFGWMPARPVSGPFLCRLSDAWAVITGKAEAVRWPDQD